MKSVLEIAAKFGTQTIETIEGQNLRDVCLACYNTDDDDHRMILTELNHRVDWDYLPVANISYLSPDIVEQHWLR